MKEEFINGFKIMTEETKITDLIPKGYISINNNVNYEYNTEYINSVLKIEIPIKKKSKTLEYYTGKLFGMGGFYQWLKEVHPKQYYSIILQMIRDDICDKQMEFNWCMAFYCSGQVDYRNLINETKPQGTVLFDTLANVKKARDLLDDNIKYLS